LLLETFHTSGNIAHIGYDVFTCESEGVRDL